MPGAATGIPTILPAANIQAAENATGTVDERLFVVKIIETI